MDGLFSNVCGMGIHFTVDGFRILYGMIAVFMWLMSGLFSREYMAHYRNRGRYYVFFILTFFATVGVFFSADFYTLYIFFEIMSFTSYVWVVQDEREESLRAGSTYLAVAVIGGLVMLMGIFLLYAVFRTLRFDELKEAYGLLALSGSGSVRARKYVWAAGFCMLFGFGAKAGAFPLHVWLPKAHPAAPAPASALLSGILTKTGVFGILVLTVYLFAGNEMWSAVILFLGVCTMFLGAVLALFSLDLKKILACSSVSQIGFILVGTGIGGLLAEENALAMRGSLLHMVNHSLIKLVLFMAAGAVYMNTHKLDLNEIRGFGRKKPLLAAVFLMGALGIGGVPLWNGYVSKTLIHEGLVEYMDFAAKGNAGLLSVGALRGVEWMFLFSGGLTVAYMAKIFIAVFVEKNADAAVQEKYDALQGKYMNKLSTAVLAASAALLPVMGFLPRTVMDRIADMSQAFLRIGSTEQPVRYFSLENIKGAAISLVIGVLISVIVRMEKKESGDRYVDRWPKIFDLENIIYRPLLLSILPMILGVLCRILDCFVDTAVVVLRKTVYRDRKLPHELEEGSRFTVFLGAVCQKLQALRQRISGEKTENEMDYAHYFAVKREQFWEGETVIARSLSFGLLLFCVGLVLTVGYLLFM